MPLHDGATVIAVRHKPGDGGLPDDVVAETLYVMVEGRTHVFAFASLPDVSLLRLPSMHCDSHVSISPPRPVIRCCSSQPKAVCVWAGVVHRRQFTNWMQALQCAAAFHRPPPTTEIEVMPAAVKMEQGGVVTYTFDLYSTVGGLRNRVHQFGGRYSHLRQVHDTLNAPPPRGATISAQYSPGLEFPSKSLFAVSSPAACA